MNPMLSGLGAVSRALLHVQVALEADNRDQARRAAAAADKIVGRLIHEAVAAGQEQAGRRPLIPIDAVTFSNN